MNIPYLKEPITKTKNKEKISILPFILFVILTKINKDNI